MSRYVDTLPTPANPRRVKFISLSTPRSGTVSTFRAMGSLGYNAYHMARIASGGIREVKLFNEAMQANMEPESGIKPYGRPEFDKWFGEYDALVEIPATIGYNLLDAYIDDPDVKFFLVERPPSAFAHSFYNTAGYVYRQRQSWIINFADLLSAQSNEFTLLVRRSFWRWAKGSAPDDSDVMENLAKGYAEYIQAIKQRVPNERLCCVQLDKGLQWEPLCELLGREVPDEPFPSGNEIRNFQISVDRHQERSYRLVARVSSSVVIGAGVIGWFAYRY